MDTMPVVERSARAKALERPVRVLAANPPTRTAVVLLNRYREIKASSRARPPPLPSCGAFSVDRGELRPPDRQRPRRNEAAGSTS